MYPLTRSTSRARFFGAAPSLLLDFLSGSLDSRITFTRASTATFSNSSGVLTSASNDVARFDYDPATLAPLGLLIEEARTNLVTRSEEFENAVWTKSNITVTANNAVAPTGATTADRLMETAVNLDHVLYFTNTQTFTTATQSIYVKPNGRNNVSLRFAFGASDWVATVFDLTGNGSITQSSAGTSSLYTVVSRTIVNAGNGWYRISMTATQPSRASYASALDLCTSPTPTLNALTGAESYLGDITKGIFAWGAQVEAGAFPTSYIPTTTTSLTRAADVASVNTLTPWYNASAGTWYAEFLVPQANSSGLWRVLSGDVANRPQIFNNASILNWEYSSDGLSSLGSLSANTVTKISGAYAVNDVIGAQNGVLGSADTSVTLNTPTAFKLGAAFSTANREINGYFRRITYYPRRLPDSALQSITL
jgi:hypothetical protein